MTPLLVVLSGMKLEIFCGEARKLSDRGSTVSSQWVGLDSVDGVTLLGSSDEEVGLLPDGVTSAN